MKPPLNYTTKIAASQTSGECLALLAQSGADHVAVSYTDRQATGLAFVLDTAHGPRSFRLPVNIDGVHRQLTKASHAGDFRHDGYRVTKYETREHAANVAWRVIRDWLDAQLALISADMATLDEVMLPYLQIEGQTLFERYAENERLAIGS